MLNSVKTSVNTPAQELQIRSYIAQTRHTGIVILRTFFGFLNAYESVDNSLPTIASRLIGPFHVNTPAIITISENIATAGLISFFFSTIFAYVIFLIHPIPFIIAPVYAPSIMNWITNRASLAHFIRVIFLCLFDWKVITASANPPNPIT